jgi:hypothetical protein
MINKTLQKNLEDQIKVGGFRLRDTAYFPDYGTDVFLDYYKETSYICPRIKRTFNVHVRDLEGLEVLEKEIKACKKELTAQAAKIEKLKASLDFESIFAETRQTRAIFVRDRDSRRSNSFSAFGCDSSIWKILFIKKNEMKGFLNLEEDKYHSRHPQRLGFYPSSYNPRKLIWKYQDGQITSGTTKSIKRVMELAEELKYDR